MHRSVTDCTGLRSLTCREPGWSDYRHFAGYVFVCFFDLCGRQGNDHTRASAEFAGYRNIAAVRVREMFDDRQSQPAPLSFARA